MLKELDSDDWEAAFEYAKPVAVLQDAVRTDAFGRGDVAEIHGIVEGENDGPPWIVWGRLYDGRWFSLSAWCDPLTRSSRLYSGWV